MCTHSNVFVLHVANALQDATPNGVTQVLNGGLGVNVAQVDGAISGAVHALCHIHTHTHWEGWAGRGSGIESTTSDSGVNAKIGERPERRGCWGVHAERAGGGRERSESTIHAESAVLVLGNIGATVFAVVYALSRPSWFGGQRRDNL